MFGSKAKAQQEQANQDYLKNLAQQQQAATQAAIAKASEVDPFTKDLEDKAQGLYDWEMGKSGPIDVRNMPGGGPLIDLYSEAKKTTDAGRIGRGLNTMSDTTPAGFTESLDKENQLTRDQAASGELERNVSGTLAANDAMLGNLGAAATNQNDYVASLQTSLYENQQGNWLRDLLQRQSKPSFWDTFAKSFGGGFGSSLGSGAGDFVFG